MLDIVIEQTKDSIPSDLLLLSDPSEEIIAEYIDLSTKFIAKLDANIVGALLLLKTRPKTMEIMNISVYEEYQNKGNWTTSGKTTDSRYSKMVLNAGT